MPLLFRNASFVSKDQLLFLHSTFSLSSYCDMNTFYFSQYRSYNKGIPSYLHGRPQGFVLHCLERWKIALGSDLSGITCQRKGLFSVMSFTNNLSKCYKVHFGNEHEMLKCSCYGWCKTGYLCKHFFAVFEKFPSWSFNALSPIYINSPFLNLDKTVIPLLKENTLRDSIHTKKQNEVVSNLEEPNEMNKSAVINLQSLPSQTRRKKTSAAIFRKYLKEVKDLSYLIENEDTLNEALDYLTNIRRLLEDAVPKDTTKAGYKRKSFSSFALPLRKKKDRNIGRHGETAQLSKKYRNVKVDLPKITRPNPIETETLILEDPLPQKKQQEVLSF